MSTRLQKIDSIISGIEYEKMGRTSFWWPRNNRAPRIIGKISCRSSGQWHSLRLDNTFPVDATRHFSTYCMRRSNSCPRSNFSKENERISNLVWQIDSCARTASGHWEQRNTRHERKGTHSGKFLEHRFLSHSDCMRLIRPVPGCNYADQLHRWRATRKMMYNMWSWHGIRKKRGGGENIWGNWRPGTTYWGSVSDWPLARQDNSSHSFFFSTGIPRKLRGGIPGWRMRIQKPNPSRDDAVDNLRFDMRNRLRRRKNLDSDLITGSFTWQVPRSNQNISHSTKTPTCCVITGAFKPITSQDIFPPKNWRERVDALETALIGTSNRLQWARNVNYSTWDLLKKCKELINGFICCDVSSAHYVKLIKSFGTIWLIKGTCAVVLWVRVAFCRKGFYLNGVYKTHLMGDEILHNSRFG